MSTVCCKEFTGWLKSFTRVERALTVVEAVLLVVLLILVLLLILHLVACSKPNQWPQELKPAKTTTIPGVEEPIDSTVTEPEHLGIYNTSNSANKSTTKPAGNCSWTPSVKTTAAIQYYEDGHTRASKFIQTPMCNASIGIGVTGPVALDPLATTTLFHSFEELVHNELSDSEEGEEEYSRHVVALVKLKPPQDIIFGCILTILSEYWTLTAASCIEAIEETDSLDSFVIMEHYGTERKGPLQTVDDVQIHPLYEGRNKTYDLAALKSANTMTKGMWAPVELASFLDFALLTLAERFIVLGYGAFRTIDSGPTGRQLRQAHVYNVPVRQCGAAGAGAALRHLGGGRAVPRGACGPPALCAGVLYSRGLPCNYCAGTPLLLRAGTAGSASTTALLGVMAASDQCGVACEPALYVNLADVDIADWVDATLRSDINKVVCMVSLFMAVFTVSVIAVAVLQMLGLLPEELEEPDVDR